MAQWLTNPTRNHEVAGSVPALAPLPLLSGLTIRRCRELWCRLQTRLGSHIAVAQVQASSYSSDSTPSLGTSICCRSSPRKGKKTKKKKKDINHTFTKVKAITNVVKSPRVTCHQ